MSGIEEMKTKIKKKMSLQDLPVSSPQNHLEQEVAVQTAVSTAVLPAESTAVQDALQQYSRTAIQEDSHTYSNTAAHTESQTVTQEAVSTATQQHSEPPRNEEKLYAQVVHNITETKNQTVYVRKVTLYLTEEMYKAFNDIYAQRILAGRKTEKSALICEAVGLLHENEQKSKRAV